MLQETLLPLHSGQTCVRAMTHADAQPYTDGTNDPMVRRYAHLPEPQYDREMVVQLIDGVIADGLASGELAILTIADRSTDRFCGSLVLFDVRDETAEVGFWVSPAARGSGHARTSLELAAQFARQSGLRRLTARTLVDNGASQRVLNDSGFAPVHQGQGIAPSGQEVELIHYERALTDRSTG